MLKTGFPWHTDFYDTMKLNEVELKEKGFLPEGNWVIVEDASSEQGSYTCGCDLFGACEHCGTTCKHWPCSCDESALGTQTGGSHYKDKKIQPVEYAHANNLGFMEANVVKYITRHKDKNKAEDIRKAIHYCQLILELEYGDKQ